MVVRTLPSPPGGISRVGSQMAAAPRADRHASNRSRRSSASTCRGFSRPVRAPGPHRMMSYPSPPDDALRGDRARIRAPGASSRTPRAVCGSRGFRIPTREASPRKPSPRATSSRTADWSRSREELTTFPCHVCTSCSFHLRLTCGPLPPPAASVVRNRSGVIPSSPDVAPFMRCTEGCRYREAAERDGQ